ARGDRIQLGRAGTPDPHLVLGDLQLHGGSEIEIGGDLGTRDLLAARDTGDHLEAGAARGAGKRRGDGEARPGQGRHDPQLTDLVEGDALEPDALPDACGAVVVRVGGAELVGLLAAGLGDVMRVAGADHDLDLGAGGDALDAGEVGAEGGETPAVAGDLDAVRPDGRVMVHRLEAQHGAQPLPARGDGDSAAVPDGLEMVAVADAGGRGLRRDGNGEAATRM